MEVQLSAWCGEGERQTVLPIRSLLLVEDEKLVREVTAEVLRRAGYQPLLARGAVEAREQFRKAHGDISLLLTDLVLTDGDGISLARELSCRAPNLRTILTSGYARDLAAVPVDQNWLFLPKPYGAEVLLDMVATVFASPMISFGSATASCR